MGRGEYRGTAKRRAQIIEAAFEEFAAGGYDQASLRSIATKVGITHPGLLYHFGSKEELLVAVLREHEEEERRQFSDRDAPKTVRDFIDRVVDAFRGELRRPQLLRLRMYFSSESGTPGSNTVANEWLERRYERVVGEIADQVILFMGKGVLPPDTDVTMSTSIFALYDGLLMHALNAPNADVSAMLAEALESLFRYRGATDL